MRCANIDVDVFFLECFLILLQMYAKAPQDHWKSKDTAIYLVTSLASKKQTSKVWYCHWDLCHYATFILSKLHCNSLYQVSSVFRKLLPSVFCEVHSFELHFNVFVISL